AGDFGRNDEVPIISRHETGRCSMTGRSWWCIVGLVIALGASADAGDFDQAASVRWVNHYGQARQLSGETNRPVLLFLTTEGCIHCTRMQNDAFQDSSIVNDLNRDFVPAKLKLNADSSLARDLRVTIYPTTVLIAPDGKILDYVRGYVPSHDLQRRMRNATLHTNSVASRTDP
ncbi:MAG: thioredoxin family protein, partial [Planctomycetales bacterium]|nr:thioredoxin family protein [Planctomycetales bacterium]